MRCRVPGKQTVPRAEFTALIRTLKYIRTVQEWTIYIDAQYVINGTKADDRSHYLIGSNGDLWQQVYDGLGKLHDKGITDINFIKVKSHVTTQEQWERYNMTEEMYVYNELADEAATVASRNSTSTATIKEDSNAKYEVAKIARRLAAIEVSIWAKDKDFNKHQGKHFDQLKKHRTDVLKRKVDDARCSTAGGDSHSIYVSGKWHRCRDCPAMAHVKNLDYWATKSCTRVVRKVTTDYMDDIRASTQHYLLHPEPEDFQLDDPEKDKEPDDVEADPGDLSDVGPPVGGAPPQRWPDQAMAKDEPLPWITAANLDDLNEMIDLEERNETVTWPTGMNARKARQLIDDERTARATLAGNYNDADLEQDLADIIDAESCADSEGAAEAAATAEGPAASVGEKDASSESQGEAESRDFWNNLGNDSEDRRSDDDKHDEDTQHRIYEDDDLEKDLADIIDAGMGNESPGDASIAVEAATAAAEEAAPTSEDEPGRCITCLTIDDAAYTCSACDGLVCTECLYDHDLICSAAAATTSHHFFPDTAAEEEANRRSSAEAKAAQAANVPPRSLTDEDKERIAKSKAAAMARKAAATRTMIDNKRKAAVARKHGIDEEAKKRRLMKDTRELAAASFNDPEAFDSFDEPATFDQHEEAASDDPTDSQPPPEPPTKKRRLTGKQKYQEAASHIANVKSFINDEWIKHGVASSSLKIHETDAGVRVIGEHRNPKVKEAKKSQPGAFANIHHTHHKMMIRNIVFCRKCGYSTSRKTQKLAEACHNKPKNNDVAHKLRRMMKGLHPDRHVDEWPDGLSTHVKAPPINIDGS